jgi:hypothetical protein
MYPVTPHMDNTLESGSSRSKSSQAYFISFLPPSTLPMIASILISVIGPWPLELYSENVKQ